MNVCITGASSGIGRALTDNLIKKGHIIWGVARRKEILENMKKSYPQGKFFYGVCNVKNLREVLKTKKIMEKEEFYPDLIILAAGVSENDLEPSFNLKSFKETFSINLFGGINFIDAFLPDFIKKGKGQFIGLSSIAAFRPNLRGIAYPASKSALSLAFRGFDLAYRKRNIYFSIIHLGPVKTPMWEGKDSFLVISPEKIAEKISKVIITKKSVSYMPFSSTFLFRLTRPLSDGVYAKLGESIKK